MNIYGSEDNLDRWYERHEQERTQPMTHTPTPYKVEQGQGYHRGHWVITAEGMPPHSPLAHVQQTCGPEESYPDAHFIITACNAHEKLVTALKAVDTALGHKFDSDLADLVDSALAHAEKVEP